MLDLVCPECGATNSRSESEIIYEFDFVYVICYNCNGTIKIPCETIIPGRYPTEAALPVLEIGEVVKIINRDHVWFGEIAIIRAKKFKHYRLELHGQLVWVPEHWVESDEPNDID